MNHTVIRNTEVDGVSGLDIRIEHGAITAIGPHLEAGTASILDADGSATIPGLTDHHLHLHALAAADRSVDCGPPAVRTPADMASSLVSAVADSGGWVRGVRYSETVAGDLDRKGLDRLHAIRPVRIQHRSGALWIMNSLGVEASALDGAVHPGIERDLDGTPTGRIWRADTWLRDRLPKDDPPDLSSIGRALAAMGITSVTDASPDLAAGSVAAIRDAMESGALPQRVRLLGLPLDDAFEPNGATDGRLTRGPYKIVMEDSAPARPDALIDVIRYAHSLNRPVAVHCASLESLVLLLFAFETVGCIDGDRVEHASLVPRECIAQIRELGLRVVSQPGFIADRGDDYLRDVEPRDLPGLYRCSSFVDEGVPLALSSDAPYGPLDPWTVISAAADRRARSGTTVVPRECISAARALDAYSSPSDDPGGSPARIAVGATADLVVLNGPVSEVVAQPSTTTVRATYIAGNRV
ncbi:amidohydrolase family protein [Rhodococcus sp. NPDC058521]|uniref:amidohydrolase family protein n=1 Tax=Rhodococcus sp. NPDC058521 TaxID=3346536 RepID=UPI00365ABAFA